MVLTIELSQLFHIMWELPQTHDKCDGCLCDSFQHLDSKKVM